MTEVRTIISIVIFTGFLLVFIAGTSLEASGLTVNNQTNTNLTFISASTTTAPVCDYSSEIPVISAFLWGVDCTVQYMNFLFSFAGLGSNVIWLGLILGGLVSGMLYIGIRLLRGGG